MVLTLCNPCAEVLTDFVDTDQILQNMASGQGLHMFQFCLPPEWDQFLKERICSWKNKFFQEQILSFKSRFHIQRALSLPFCL